MYLEADGVVNAGKEGTGKDATGKYTWQPNGNYDGQVVISPTSSYKEDGSTKSRRSVIFHELAENYERVNNGVDYKGFKGAHALSQRRERGYWGKSLYPGAVSDPISPMPPRDEMKNLYNLYMWHIDPSGQAPPIPH
jgi:hypothetical protein